MPAGTPGQKRGKPLIHPTFPYIVTMPNMFCCVVKHGKPRKSKEIESLYDPLGIKMYK